MNQPHHAHRNHHNHHQHNHPQQHHHQMHQQTRMPISPSMPPQQQWVGAHPQPAQTSQAQHHPQQPAPQPPPTQQQPHQPAAQHHQQQQQQQQQQQHHHPPQLQQHHHQMQTPAQMPISPPMPPQQQWIGPHPPPAQSNPQAQHHPQQPVQHHAQPPQQPPPQQPQSNHHLTHSQAGPMMINQQYHPNFIYSHQPLVHPFGPPSGHINQYEHPTAASHQSGPVNVNSQQQQQQVSINNHHPNNVTLSHLHTVSTPTTTNVNHLNNGPLLDTHMSNRMQLNQPPYLMPYVQTSHYTMLPYPVNINAYQGGPPPNPAMIPQIRIPSELSVRQPFDPTRTPTTPLATPNLNQPLSTKPPSIPVLPPTNLATSITTAAPVKPREKKILQIVDPKTKHVFTLDELTDSPKSENNTSKDSGVSARISGKDQLILDKESSLDEATTKSAGDSSASEMVIQESRKSPDSTVSEPKLTEPIRISEPIQEVKVEITDTEDDTEPVVKICDNESTKVKVDDDLAADIANLNISEDKRSSDEKDSSTETPVKKQSLPNLPYAAGQYSPMNPNGSKRYTIDFLRAVAQEMKIDIQTSSDQRIDSFVPHYVNHNDRGNYRNDFSSQPLTRRSSQQVLNKPRKIIATHSLQQEVELKTAEKPWKPELNEEKIKVIETGEMDTKRLLKVFRGHLNKLTPQKYDSLIEKIMALNLVGPERLSSVIDLVFDKAVDEPGFCELYARMCRSIAYEYGEFNKHLIMKCQEEFETFDLYEGLGVEKRKADIELETDATKKKIMSEELYEDMRLRRKKYLGTIKLIGEMYKFDLLSSKIIGICMNHLINGASNENIECLCSLLETVGPKMSSESTPVKDGLKNTLNILNSMANSEKAPDFGLDNRIKFKILDTMDLSRNFWKPRKAEHNPRMITEIREEAEKQRQQNHSSQPKSLSKPDDRDRIRDRRPNHAPPPRGKPF